MKLAPVVLELRRRKGFRVVVCVTGQHREMLDQVLDLFEIVPEHDLHLMKVDQRPLDLAAAAMTAVGKVIEAERPDLVVVQGDTATAMAAGLAGFFQRTAVAHVEAGLRTGIRTSPFPEELTRRVITQVAELHFAPTVRSAENLHREHADDEGNIFLTGNTVIDAVRWISERRKGRSSIVRKAPRLALVTAHRRENFGEPIRSICRALRRLVDRNRDLEIAYPVHLNPNIQTPVRELLSDHDRIQLLAPLSYEQLIYAMQDAEIVLTDSGGLQEEAPFFGKPVLVLRRDTERPEAIEAGTAILAGTDEDNIVAQAEHLLHDRSAYLGMAQARSPFGDGYAAPRIADILAAWHAGDTASLASSRWNGVGGLDPYRSAVAQD